MGNLVNCCGADDIDELHRFQRIRNIDKYQIIYEDENKNNNNSDFPIHAAVLEKDSNKLSTLILSNTYDINELDYHGYTALHLAVFLLWQPGIQILLAANASPLIASLAGWTAIQESISISHKQTLKQLLESIINQRAQISSNNIRAIASILEGSPSFYLELNLELFAKGFAFANSYLPSDVLKIWKTNNRVRVDMTLLDFDQHKMQWQRGNISYLFHIEDGVLNFYYTNHDTKEISSYERARLYLDDDNSMFSLNASDLADDFELHKLLQSPVVSRRVVVEDATLALSRSWIGTTRDADINGFKCALYETTNVKFMIKQRDSHVPEALRSKLEVESTDLMAMLKENENCAQDDDEDDTKYNVNYKYGEWRVPTINVNQYTSSYDDSSDIIRNRKNTSHDELFRINNCKTHVSSKSYNMWIAVTTQFGIQLDVILAIFDLLSLRANHVEKIKQILKVTVYNQRQFPLQIEMPLLLNVVRAKVTFQNLKKQEIDPKIFDIPNY